MVSTQDLCLLHIVRRQNNEQAKHDEKDVIFLLRPFFIFIVIFTVILKYRKHMKGRNNMFELRDVTGVGSDCTSGYHVDFYNKYTVKEFINEILTKYPREFGFMSIKSGKKYVASIEFSMGDITGDDGIDEEVFNSVIKSATASGGWGQMNYDIII